jgi:hypothetical protein
MKQRATKKTKEDDLLASELDFSRLGKPRRNAFAGAGEPHGPSLQSLWEMPELSPNAMMVRRGRPASGQAHTTVVKSIRLPEALWLQVAAKAAAKHLNLHQAMRTALLRWMKETG